MSGLSCSCMEWTGEDGSWAFYIPNDFRILDTHYSRRCSSCKDKIKPGDSCLKFPRIRSPKNDIEERIYGEEIPLSPLWMCEKCGEIYLNLEDIGYCVNPEDHMPELLEEYHEITGFKKDEKGLDHI